MWRTLAAAAALVVLCALLLAFGLFPQDWLRPIVERQVRAALGPGSRIGGLHVVPGRLRAVATDVVIEGRGFRLDAPRMAMTLALPTVLGRAMALRSFEMQHAVLTVWPVEAEGERAEPAPLEQAVLVGDIRVTDGTFIYRDPALGGDWRVRDIRLTGGIGEGTLTLETGPVRWEKPEPIVLQPIRARMSLSPLLKAQIESLEMGTARSRITASGDVGELTRPDLDVSASVRLDLADARLVPNAPQGSGIVTGDVQLKGSLPELAVSGTLQGRGLVVEGKRIDSATLRFSRAGEDTNAVLEAAAFGGRVNADAKLDGAAIEASGRAANVDLVQLGGTTPGRATLDFTARGRLRERLAVVARVEAAGRVQKDVAFTARANVDGALVGPEYAAELKWNAAGTADQPADPAGGPSLQELRWNAAGSASGAWPPAVNGSFDGAGRFASASGASAFDMKGTLQSRGETTSATAVLTGDVGRVHVAATSSPARNTLDVAGQEVRLERFLRGAHGLAQFSFKGHGPPGALAGRGQGSIEELRASGVSFGTVAIDAGTERGTTRVTFRVPDLRADGEVTIAPARPRARDLAMTAHLRLQDSPLAALAPLAGRPLAGRIRGTFDVQAPLRSPADARVQGTIEALEVEADRLRAALQQPARIEATQRRLVVHEVSLKGPGFELRADGGFGLVPAEPNDARITTNVDLATVPAPVDWTLGGSAQGDLRVRGTRARPLVHGAVDLTGLAAAGPRLPPLAADKAHLELAGDSLRIAETEATFAGGRLRLSGTVPLASVMTATAPESAHIDVVWNGIDAAQIHMAAAPDAEVAVSGVLEGEAHVTGRLTSLAGVTARVRTPPLQLTVAEMPVTVSRLELDVADGRLSFTPVEIGTPDGSLSVKGGADLAGRTLDVSAAGRVDLRAFSPLLQNAALSGRAAIDVALRGTFDAPRPTGTVTLTRGSLRMRHIQPPMSDIEGTVAFDSGRLRIDEMKGLWGGGRVTISGGGAVSGAELRDIDLAIRGEDLALRYYDTKTLVTADLRLSGRTGNLLLAGRVDLERGLYDKDLFWDDPLRAPKVEDLSSPFQRTLGLDLRVKTIEPFIVSNNVAALRASGDLTIRGTAETPRPYGYFVIEEKGKVVFQAREFLVREGSLRYEGRMDPRLDIEAVSVKTVDIDKKNVYLGVDITGTLDAPTVAFKNADTDTDFDTVRTASILATGHAPGEEDAFTLLGGQGAAWLAGRVGVKLQRRLQSLGLDQVTIEPNLIGNEDDPSARFTFGKNVTPWAHLTYSHDLKDANEQYVRVDLGPFATIGTYVTRERERWVYGLSREFRLGGDATKSPPAEVRTRLTEVRVEGRMAEQDPTLRDKLGVGPGDERGFWELQAEADGLQKKLVALGHIEAQVTARLEGTVAVFSVRGGPRYDWRVEGMSDPPDLGPAVRKAFYAEEAVEAGERRLLVALRDRDHLRAKVTSTIERKERQRTLVFRVEPGPLVADADVVFEGATVFSSRALVKAAGGTGELLTDPAAARRRVVERYREAYYLATRVGPPEVTERADRLQVRVPVQEGPPARITRITITGHTVPESELMPFVQGLVDKPPDETATEAGLRGIQDRYFKLGYRDLRIDSRLVPLESDVELVLQIEEGAQVHIREVVIEGGRHAPEGVIRGELPFRVGEPLDPRKLAQAEARLAKYEFGRVRVSSDPDDPSRVVIAISSGPPLVGNVELNMDSDMRAGANINVRAPNLVARGVTPGLSLEEKRVERTGRGWLRMPALLHRGLLNFSLLHRKEAFGPDGARARISDPREELFQITTTYLSALQQADLGGQWVLEYGYQLSQVRTESRQLALPFSVKASKVQASLLRDTRNNILDARRGRFWSLNVAYAPPGLKSQVEFVKAYGQLFVYRPVSDHFTWAHAYRIGAGRGKDGESLFLTERFQAGGPNDLRGFAADFVGPLDALDQVRGGDAIVVFNQELRYHHSSGFGAAVFYDAGNVWGKTAELDLKLRHAVGTGLRYVSPVGVLRVDFGVPLNPRTFDDRYQVFFGIGQAF